MFIVFWKNPECEVVVNTSQISKIEIRYATKVEGDERSGITHQITSLDDAKEQPAAQRFYTIFVAGEEFRVIPDNSRAWRIIDEICRSAVRD